MKIIDDLILIIYKLHFTYILYIEHSNMQNTNMLYDITKRFYFSSLVVQFLGQIDYFMFDAIKSHDISSIFRTFSIILINLVSRMWIT